MTTLLRREIGLLLRFSHPHIVTFLGAVTIPNELGACLVMELCLGGTAASRPPKARTPLTKNKLTREHKNATDQVT